MRCRTIATVASLVLLFTLGRAQAGLIDNSTVTILPSSTPAFISGTYPQSDAIDVGPNMYVTDYASNGGGNSTHLDFAFPTPELFSQITYTDRTTGGGSNGGFVGGTSDSVTSYELIFATDAAFTNVVGIVPETKAVPSGANIASFQQTDMIPDILAQYVRFQVVLGGTNDGAADFEFTTAPEPSSVVALVGLGAMGLFVVARRRVRKAA